MDNSVLLNHDELICSTLQPFFMYGRRTLLCTNENDESRALADWVGVRFGSIDPYHALEIVVSYTTQQCTTPFP